MNLRIILTALFLVIISHVGCHSSKELENLNAEDRYQLAKKEFDDGDYLQAIEDFRVITLQFPGSTVADSAQFYLAQSYYHRDQFILAAAEYESLIRSMSTSKFVPQARYEIAMCYNALSPTSDLDQKYTLKALDAFQSFIEYQPTNPLVPQAEEKIRELNTKLAKKEYDSGVIYMKMENYRAAERQFNFVLEKYHDTEYADRAHLSKIEVLVARKRFAEAMKEAERFIERYPSSPLLERVQSLKKDIEAKLHGLAQPRGDSTATSEKTSPRIEVK